MSPHRTFRTRSSIALLALALLTACGGGGEADPTPETPSEDTPEDPSEGAAADDATDATGVADRSPCDGVADADVTALLGGEPEVAYEVAPGEFIPDEAGMAGGAGFPATVRECVRLRAQPDARSADETNALRISVDPGDADGIAGYREFYEGLGACTIEDGTTVGQDGIDVRCDTPDGGAVLVAHVGVVGDAIVNCNSQAAGVDPASHAVAAAAFCQGVAADLGS